MSTATHGRAIGPSHSGGILAALDPHARLLGKMIGYVCRMRQLQNSQLNPVRAGLWSALEGQWKPVWETSGHKRSLSERSKNLSEGLKITKEGKYSWSHIRRDNHKGEHPCLIEQNTTEAYK